MNVVTVTMARPVNDSHFAPYLSNKRPVIGDIMPMAMAPGSSTSPDSSGVNPRTFCMKSGSNVSAPINDTNTVMVIMMASVKIGNLNTLNSSIGVSSTNRSEVHTSELQSRGHIVCRL